MQSWLNSVCARATASRQCLHCSMNRRWTLIDTLARARSWCMQFRVLLRRALLAQLRNPTDVTARLFLSCYVGPAGWCALGITIPGHSMLLRYRMGGAVVLQLMVC